MKSFHSAQSIEIDLKIYLLRLVFAMFICLKTMPAAGRRLKAEIVFEHMNIVNARLLKCLQLEEL